MGNELTDLEKQKLLSILYLQKVHATGLDALALRIAESISEERERETALLTTSYYLAQSGNEALALEAGRQLNPYGRASSLAAIAAEISAEDHEKAVLHLTVAEALLRDHISDPDEQSIVLTRISDAYLQMHDWERAHKIARKIPTISDRVSNLCRIVEYLWNRGEVQCAAEVMREARANAAETTAGNRSSALVDVARTLGRMGQAEEAVDIWDQAALLSEYAPDPSQFLVTICGELISLGRTDRARDIMLQIRNEARRAAVLSMLQGAGRG